MATEDFKRKLTAVFSADVAGYSRLMGEDEAATVKTLETYKQVMFTLIKQHRGRVIDSPGDNLLAEFASVVDAVQCAVAVQKELQARNAELPENRRMQFRIGINLGDVIEEGDRIYGDGVNIAARLESCADPGGICVSKTAFDQIESKLPLGYEFLGEQEVKNIAKPVGAYRVLMEPRVTVAGAKEKEPSIPLWRRKGVLAGAVAVLIVIVGVAVWNLYWRAPKIEPASKEKMAFPLPDKPSVAVLPFANMSDDPKQEYLADGISENIISALSQVPNLFVIARNSTFTYKGKPVKVQQVAEELGVRYVLEGSVQRSGDTLRITAQLIDAVSGHHMWSERYDRELKKLFALQDDITMKVITALRVKLTGGDQARLLSIGTENLQAYLKSIQGREALFTVTKEGNAQARRLAEEVIALDPQFPSGYLLLSSVHFMDVFLGISKSPGESLKQSLELAEKAKAMDDTRPISTLGFLYILTGRQYDKAIAECERAIALAPNSAECHSFTALVLSYAGRHEQAVRHAEQALRLNPLAPGWQYRILGNACFQAGRYEEAITAHKKGLSRAPNDLVTKVGLTTAYSWAGRPEEARAQAAEVLRINPKFSVEGYGKTLQYKNQADLDRFLEGLRKAGLPEKPAVERADQDKMAFPLPDVPSIAVLPFVNMSGDPKQGFLSDGITENIITALTKVPRLLVIARNSTFVYKGKPVNVKQVSEELGVQYILEGSIQRSADRIRITAQLIDALKGHHIWAERYDCDLTDLFSLQDEIAIKILTALRVKFTEGEQASTIEKYVKGKQGFDCYLKLMEAYGHIQRWNIEDNNLARSMIQEVIAKCPENPLGYSALGWVYHHDYYLGHTKSSQETLEKSLELAQKALAIDDSVANAHSLLCLLYAAKGEHDKAIAEGERAVSLNPGGTDALNEYAWSLNHARRCEEAIPLFQKAIRLNPFGKSSIYRGFGMALFNTGRLEEAVSALRTSIQRSPDDIMSHILLTAAYSMLGKEKEASIEAAEILRINPKFSVDNYARRLSPPKDTSQRDAFLNALRKAGLK